MDEIIKLLKTEPLKAIELLTKKTKDVKSINNLKKEFKELDRNQRATQIGKVQKNKTVGTGDKARLVEAVRTPIGIQNKIVNTATSFEVGEAPSILSDVSNDLVTEVLRIWKKNRIDSLLQKVITLKKSQLQCAILFKITNVSKKTLFRSFIGPNKVKEIKAQILENENGSMTPYFDVHNDMVGFVWEFNTINSEGKSSRNVWVYDEKNIHMIDESKGTFGYNKSEIHGFDRIPIIYLSQEKPEWHVAETLIDRMEVTLSKLGASNDYCGHPIAKLFGEVEGAPDKNDDGKAFVIKMIEDEETGKIEKKGDVEYLTYEQAPEAIKLEMDQLLKFIYSTTSTPDWSFDNLKSMGSALSGKAFKMMLIDPIMKAKMNEGENRTLIERILNVITSGVVNHTVTTYKKHIEETSFTVHFNSIIPDDFETSIEAIVKAKDAKLISQKTGIGLINVADVEEEIQQIEDEYVETEPNPDIKKD